MPRPLLLLLAALIIITASAHATTTRVRSLGGQSDYLEDDSGVLRWYGSLVDYPQLATIDLGDWSHDTGDIEHAAGGLHYQFDEAGKWGTAATYFGDDLPEPDPGGWFRLLWARRFGKVSLGATFRGTSHSAASSGPPEHFLQGESQFIHDLGLGARWDLSDRLYADLAAEIREGEIDYYDAEHGITVEDDGGFDSYGLRGRLFHGLNKNAAAIYRLEWYRDRRAVTDPTMNDLVDLDARTFKVGLGFNILPDPDNLVLASVDYDRREEDRRARHPFFADWTEAYRLWWRLDMRVGVESRLLPWLTLRAAASYRRTVDELALTYTWPDDYAVRSYDYKIDVRTPVVVGVGLHFGSFDADLAINDSALYDPNAGSARRDVGEDDTFTSLTLRYAF